MLFFPCYSFWRTPYSFQNYASYLSPASLVLLSARATTMGWLLSPPPQLWWLATTSWVSANNSSFHLELGMGIFMIVCYNSIICFAWKTLKSLLKLLLVQNYFRVITLLTGKQLTWNEGDFTVRNWMSNYFSTISLVYILFFYRYYLWWLSCIATSQICKVSYKLLWHEYCSWLTEMRVHADFRKKGNISLWIDIVFIWQQFHLGLISSTFGDSSFNSSIL